MTLEEHWKSYATKTQPVDYRMTKGAFFMGALTVHIELNDAVVSGDFAKVRGILNSQRNEFFNYHCQTQIADRGRKESWLWQRVTALFSSR